MSANWTCRAPNVFEEYEITITTPNFGQFLAAQKLAQAIVEGKVESPSNVAIRPNTKEEN